MYALIGLCAAMFAALCVAGVTAWVTKAKLEALRIEAIKQALAALTAERNAITADRDVLQQQATTNQQKETDAKRETVAHGDAASVDAVIDSVLANQLPDLAESRAIADVDTVFDSSATQSVSAPRDHE